ncbi:alpha/beta hydrolase [Photobacterium rosenbergii]|uniref:alpha/beta hydrolase n=1 Tax=Photobacterium rosenbergii TaxID=294936 RepID=UPI001C9A20C8|nr:alpha/beta hydrolase [Photobacterium rosenbergii]MBY5943683.1 alpha/beta hydrolase [Photobacterium rosenbergii]
MKRLLGVILLMPFFVHANSMVIWDSARERSIPIEIEHAVGESICSLQKPCNVAFVSAGNKVPFTQYQFLTKKLNRLGYMTVAVDHELPNDPPLSKNGDLYQTRIENWQRGADTLDFLQQQLAGRYPTYDFNKLTLVGHSNGGDISAWLANSGKGYVYQIITLDHKRVALPRTEKIKVLSVRATEYPTKQGVLPTELEQKKYGSCILEIPNSKHMDLSDYGSAAVMSEAKHIMTGFINGLPCDSLRRNGQ